MEDKVVKELSRLVSIKSESGHEEEILTYLEARLKALGFPTFRQEVVEDRFNLIWTHSLRPKLLLSAHVDTVHDFGNADLYFPRVEEGRLYGRGSVDNKAGIAAILLALELAREKGVKAANFGVAFTVDEEQKGLGSKALPELLHAEGAVVLEPTELMICAVEAGSIEVRIEITGTPAHGGDFESGENPIMRAISLVEKFKKLDFIQGHHPLIGKSGFNIMEIKGGESALVVPDRCELFVDFRVLPGQNMEEVEGELIRLFEREEVKTEFVEVDPPFELREEEQIVQLIKRAYERALGEAPRVGGMRSWTDAGNFVYGGIPSVVFGPGKLAVAHTPWENVEVSEVVAAVKILYQLILEVSDFPH
ncbi:MAG TPA: M20/M25/M40 family metallo-hydrolase [Thermodesulfobacteriota bacterium]|nr:M20/M25/M40 family metallo-hydrolase [Thermodesulfobacteriota bacterium]